MSALGRLAIGSVIGAALAAVPAPWLRPLFPVPSGGIGAVTAAAYPKSWDYAVIALVITGAFVGALVAAARTDPPSFPDGRPSRRAVWLGTVIVFVLMVFIHDHPHAPMDPFHEGEHLTPGLLMKNGARPFGDVFVLHGLAADGGFDALVLGDPPSPLGPRRLQTLLDALTLALLVPIAAELTATATAMGLAVFASLCATAALWIPVFPYYRLAPILLAALGLLRYVRSGRAMPLLVAFASATLGVLWSLDTGLYAIAGVAGLIVALRVLRLEPIALPSMQLAGGAVLALLLPVAVLLVVRADIGQFLQDSFITIPRAIDAVWSLPAPAMLTAPGVRYFLPLVFYGFLLALSVVCWRSERRYDAARLLIVVVLSVVLFRTAAGRVSWSHTRYAMPLLGIALTGFVLEPLMARRRWIAVATIVIPLFFYLEVAPNVAAGSGMLARWASRQRPDGLVPYPVRTGRGLYTWPQHAADLAALKTAIDALGPGPILDFSNERALYYLLERKPPMRCPDIPMLSAPVLLAEAMAQLIANPPVAVIVKGDPLILAFDGVSTSDRVPDLARWIDSNYPIRRQIGRFTLATP